ncbi:nucleotide-binding protein [Escherichia coli]|nr:nucleotide-binding protein [Escherichia coli]MCW7419142.1 nucleotide-binding protein [Escherichia coli]
MATYGGQFTLTCARQNVLYELGYFAGKLGRGKVLVLRKEISKSLQILPGFSIPSLMSMVDGNANC